MGAPRLPAVACLLAFAAACNSGPKPDLYGSDPHSRALALAEIESMPAGDTLRRVLELLEDPHPMTRRAAVAALGRIGEPKFIPHVLLRMRDADAGVRAEACAAAGRLRAPDAIPDLAYLAADRGERLEVRQQAVKALAAFPPRRDVVRALIAVLPERPGAHLRPDIAREGIYSEAMVFRAAHEALERLTGRTGTRPVRGEWEEWFSSLPNASP
jgi:hypothetical protein